MDKGKSESVMLNPLGPHFYVADGTAYEFPEKWRDAVTDRMNQILEELDEEWQVPVSHEHIYGHVEITQVYWDDEDFTIKKPDSRGEWYSREQLSE